MDFPLPGQITGKYTVGSFSSCSSWLVIVDGQPETESLYNHTSSVISGIFIHIPKYLWQQQEKLQCFVFFIAAILICQSTSHACCNESTAIPITGEGLFFISMKSRQNSHRIPLNPIKINEITVLKPSKIQSDPHFSQPFQATKEAIETLVAFYKSAARKAANHDKAAAVLVQTTEVSWGCLGDGHGI